MLLEYMAAYVEGLVGPAPVSVRWTCLMMDLRYVLSVYLNRTHSHLKSVKLCAYMAVKNLVTSDLLLDPGTCSFFLTKNIQWCFSLF